jgi:hypothetical protein
MKTVKSFLTIIIACSTLPLLPAAQILKEKNVSDIIAKFEAATHQTAPEHKKTIPEIPGQPLKSRLAAYEPQPEVKIGAQSESKRCAAQEVSAKHGAAAQPIRRFNSLQELQEHYLKELTEQREFLMKLFFEVTGATQKQFALAKTEGKIEAQALMRANQKQMLADSKKIHGLNFLNPTDPAVSGPTQEQATLAAKINALALALFKQQNITPPEIFFSLEWGGGMSVDPFIMAVYLPVVEPYSNEALQAIICHEIGHIKFEDKYTQIGIAILLDKYKPEYSNGFMQLWEYFSEKEADIYSMTRGFEYAKGFLEYFTHPSKQETHFSEGVSHQSDANRAVIARQIYNEILALPCTQPK